MTNLVEKANDVMSTVEACELLLKICICKGSIICADFCKHYAAMNKQDYVLCPAQRSGDTSICVGEIIDTVKSNPKQFKKLLQRYTNAV